MACAFENERTIRTRSRAASRAATSSSGANSASAASTTSQTRLGEPLGQAAQVRASVAPVGSFGVQSTTALVPGSTAASASASGAPPSVSGTGTGAAPGLVDEPGQRAPAGPGDRDPAAGGDRAERRVQQLAGAVAGRDLVLAHAVALGERPAQRRRRPGRR